ncbi:MAG: T9SS type A sorting domain-containing protein [Chitinophagales bacterium]
MSSTNTIWGQTATVRNCSAMDVLEQKMAANPSLELSMEAVERHTQEMIATGQTADRAVVTIPTVVHIIYSNSNENISEAQIQSQMQVLNDDFRRLNSDANNTWSQAADTEIEFCLASVDPNGNPTTGITRKSSNTTSWGTNDAMKSASNGGVNAWPAGEYLNMWICNIGGGILGYAQFPGGSASTDGVVMSPQYFGTTGYVSAPFDGGRTTTHEVGHWLNLRHIWGDGNCNADDLVNDTPTSDAANYGCATGHTSCNSTDMVQNYMDYSDDSCMNLFTAGQKSRMQSLFANGGFRASLLNSNGCGNAGPLPTCDDGIMNGSETGVDCGGADCEPCPCFGTNVNVSITLDNYGSETSWAITNASGATVASGGPYTDDTNGEVVNVDVCLNDGCYDFTMNDSYGDGMCCQYGNGSYLVTAATTLASGSEFAASETTNFCIGGNGPTCNDGIMNGSETGVDCGGADCAPCATSCGMATGLEAVDFTSSGVTLQWDAQADAQAYQLAGRKTGGNWKTFPQQTTNFRTFTSGIQPNTDYQFSVRVLCDGTWTDWVQPVGEFSTAGSARLGQATDAFDLFEDAATLSSNVYPNPATDKVTVSFTTSTEGLAQVRILDLAGRTIISAQHEAAGLTNEVELNTTQLDSGYYFVEVTNGTERSVSKLNIIK